MKVVKPQWIQLSDSLSLGSGSPIFSLDMDATRERLATGGQGDGCGLIVLWHLDPVLTAASARPRELCRLTSHASCVNSVRFAPPGSRGDGGKQWLASGAVDGLVMLWCLMGGGDATSNPLFGGGLEHWRCAATLRGHEGDVLDLQWSPAGDRLATASVDNTVAVWQVWPVGQHRKLASLRGHTGLVKGVTWDPVGRYLASQSDDGSLRVWRTDTWRQEARVTDPFKGAPQSTPFLRPSWSPDGSFIVAANAVNSGFPTAPLIWRDKWASDMDLVGHIKAVTCCAVAPCMLMTQAHSGGDGSGHEEIQAAYMALGSKDRSVSVWQTSLKRPLLALRDLFAGSVCDLAWSRDGLLLAAASHDGSVAVLQFDQAELLGRPVSRSELARIHQRHYGNTALLDAPASQCQFMASDPHLFKLQQAAAAAAAAATSAATAPGPQHQQHRQLPSGPPEQLESRGKDGKRRITPKFLGHLLFSEQQQPPAATPEDRLGSPEPPILEGPVSLPPPPPPPLQATPPPPPSSAASATPEKLTSQAPKLKTKQQQQQKPPPPPKLVAMETDSSSKSKQQQQPQQSSAKQQQQQRKRPQQQQSQSLSRQSSSSNAIKRPAPATTAAGKSQHHHHGKHHDARHRHNNHSEPSQKPQKQRRVRISSSSSSASASASSASSRSGSESALAADSAVSDASQESSGCPRSRRAVTAAVASLPFRACRLDLGGDLPLANARLARVERWHGGGSAGAAAAAASALSLCLGDTRLWTVPLSRGATCLAAGGRAIAVGDSSGRLHLFGHDGGRLCPPILMDGGGCGGGCGFAGLAAGEDGQVAAVSRSGWLTVWRTGSGGVGGGVGGGVARVLRELVPAPGGAGGSSEPVGIASVSLHGSSAVLLALTSGHALCYSAGQGAWLELQDPEDPGALAWHRSHPRFPEPGGGPLSQLQAAAASARPSSASVPATAAAAAVTSAAAIASFLERQVCSARALESQAELRHWLGVYARHLASSGLESRLRALCEDLLGPAVPSASQEQQQRLLGFDKRDLLRQVVLPAFALNLGMQRLFQEVKQQLDLFTGAAATTHPLLQM